MCTRVAAIIPWIAVLAAATLCLGFLADYDMGVSAGRSMFQFVLSVPLLIFGLLPAYIVLSITTVAPLRRRRTWTLPLMVVFIMAYTRFARPVRDAAFERGLRSLFDNEEYARAMSQCLVDSREWKTRGPFEGHNEVVSFAWDFRHTVATYFLQHVHPASAARCTPLVGGVAGDWQFFRLDSSHAKVCRVAVTPASVPQQKIVQVLTAGEWWLTDFQPERLQMFKAHDLWVVWQRL